MAEFTRIAAVADLAPGTTRSVEHAGQAIALFNIGGTIYATSNTCAHRGGPLGEGTLDGTTVTCPWHGFQFDVPSGACRTNPALSVACYPVRIEGQDVLIKL